MASCQRQCWCQLTCFSSTCHCPSWIKTVEVDYVVWFKSSTYQPSRHGRLFCLICGAVFTRPGWGAAKSRSTWRPCYDTKQNVARELRKHDVTSKVKTLPVQQNTAQVGWVDCVHGYVVQTSTTEVMLATSIQHAQTDRPLVISSKTVPDRPTCTCVTVTAHTISASYSAQHDNRP